MPTLAAAALLAMAVSCGGGSSNDADDVPATDAPATTVDAPAATDAPPAPDPSATVVDDVDQAPAGEILLEPIGVAMPDAFSPTMVLTPEQLPPFPQPAYLRPGGATADTNTAADAGAETTVPADPNEPPSADEPAPTTTATSTATTTTTSTATTTSTSGEQVPLTQIAGNVPGLYGGTRDVVECDQQAQIEFLEANPDKAAAWASVHGIEVTDIRAYIEDLTPVVLLRDTRVTNHGFADGRAQPHQSVLQAGHAVLVDRFGVPRAKCSCGNPLAPPQPVSVAPEYTGATWPGFDPADIVVVIAPVAVENGFVIVDLGNGELITRPIGYAPDMVDADISPLLDTGNRLGVQPGAEAAPSFTVNEPTLIVAMVHYHYGPETPPGQVGLTRGDGSFYGPWQTTGREGQGGVADAYWTAIPYEIVPAGTYTVWDSEPSTWSTNADAGGLGFSVVRGIVGMNLPPAPGNPDGPPDIVDGIDVAGPADVAGTAEPGEAAEPANPAGSTDDGSAGEVTGPADPGDAPDTTDPAVAAAAAHYITIVSPNNCAHQLSLEAEEFAPGWEDGVIDAAEYPAYQAYWYTFDDLGRMSNEYFALELESYDWPADVQPLVDQIVPLVWAEAAAYEALLTMPYDAWVDFQFPEADRQLFDELRRGLGLPPAAGDQDWCANVAG